MSLQLHYQVFFKFKNNNRVNKNLTFQPENYFTKVNQINGKSYTVFLYKIIVN